MQKKKHKNAIAMHKKQQKRNKKMTSGLGHHKLESKETFFFPNSLSLFDTGKTKHVFLILFWYLLMVSSPS